MAQKTLQYGFVVVITFCIGYGDGRWKKRDKDNLYHEIDLFKKMAEKIEHEIEAFYEDYPEKQIKEDDIEKTHRVYAKNKLERKTKTDLSPGTKTKQQSTTSNTTNQIPGNLASENDIQSQPIHVSFIRNDSLSSSVDWPKFEDILLEMGKRYDWKNDRWIKVKRKLKEPLKKVATVDSSISFHEKHKFSYKTVKLNRKSRRNIVIAVTAVR